MNTKLSKLVVIAIVFILGATVDHVYSSEVYTELYATKSGTFVIRNGRIFCLEELDSTYAPIDRGIMK